MGEFRTELKLRRAPRKVPQRNLLPLLAGASSMVTRSACVGCARLHLCDNYFVKGVHLFIQVHLRMLLLVFLSCTAWTFSNAEAWKKKCWGLESRGQASWAFGASSRGMRQWEVWMWRISADLKCGTRWHSCAAGEQREVQGVTCVLGLAVGIRHWHRATSCSSAASARGGREFVNTFQPVLSNWKRSD